MKKVKFLFTLWVLSLVSCTTFHQLENKNPLIVKNLSAIDGVYEARPKFGYHHLWLELDRNQLKDTLKIQAHKNYKMGIKVLEKNKLKLEYIEDDKVVRERILKAKFKKDGYLYLKNKNVAFLGVPYILGAVDVKNVRLGLTPENHLIFDVAEHRSGAMFLIGFLDGRFNSYRLVFHRTEMVNH